MQPQPMRQHIFARTLLTMCCALCIYTVPVFLSASTSHIVARWSMNGKLAREDLCLDILKEIERLDNVYADSTH